MRAAASVDRALITEVGVFDVFTGQGVPEGKKSLAIEVTLQPSEKTLTDARDRGDGGEDRRGRAEDDRRRVARLALLSRHRGEARLNVKAQIAVAREMDHRPLGERRNGQQRIDADRAGDDGAVADIEAGMDARA